MKKIILLLLLWIILFNRCDSDLPIIGKSNTEKESVYSKITQMCFFVRLGGGPSGYKVVDNNDGTVALVNYSSLGSEYCPPPFGKTESILSIKYYIKKCIQGQVYRQAQNDCKGTGTAANYWGAQKLQRCLTNTAPFCGNLASPSSISCANDITAGRKWETDNFSGGTGIKNVQAYFLSRKEEIPTGIGDYYWSGYDASLTDINGYSTGLASGYFGDDSFNYVLCFTKKS